MIASKIIFKQLGLQNYEQTFAAMQEFTTHRTADTQDEIWLLEHPPVFTQGLNGKPEHVLNQQHIPIVKTDRGGQVTYHGPGQLIAYLLLDLKRLNMGVRPLVSLLENSVIELLKKYNITAQARCDAPGVYVDQAKICSLGLRIRRGCSYHGLALNVAMDLAPFSQINPCGFKDLTMTQMSAFNPRVSLDNVREELISILEGKLG